MPGIEHRPTVMYTAAVATGRMTAVELVRLLAENPAKLFGVWERKGSLTPGKDADVVIYDPRVSQTISAQTQRQNCDYTPYEGFRTAGAVRDVFLRGIHAVQGGKLMETGCGQYVARGKMR